jgi:hypothetical protein
MMIHNNGKHQEQIIDRKKKIPKLYQGIYTKAASGRSHKAAIYIQCLECCKWQIRKVFLCTNLEYLLYHYRPQSKVSQETSESISDKIELHSPKQGNREKKREGILEPKPPELLQNIAWIWKYVIKHLGKNHLVVMLAMLLPFFYWGYELGFFVRSYYLSKNEMSNGYGNIRLNLQIFINTDKIPPATKYDNEFIQHKRKRYEGTPENSFWSDYFIHPFIEDTMTKVSDQTVEDFQKNNINFRP